MKIFNVKLQLFVLAVLMGGAAVADPPTGPKNFWRNLNLHSHYIMYERSSNTYVETVNCKPAWRFTKTGGNLNEVHLYDAGRKLAVKLSYTGMWLKFDHETAWKFYQAGTFDKRVRFFHQYNGQWTGTVSRLHGCAWEERLAGGSNPAWRFQAYGEDAGSTFLFDSSRNMRVRLNVADMWLQESGKATFSFFKKGYWSVH